MNKLRMALLVLLPTFSGFSWGVPIEYRDFIFGAAVKIGSTTYSCDAGINGPTCVELLSVIGEGDTDTVQPFSVPGAGGLKNTISSATVSVLLNSGLSFTETLLPGQIYVSVDQTNGGAGFGSAYGATYPAATYAGGDYAHYDLASDFYVMGFAPFCPDVNLCRTGAPLHTVSGDDIVISLPFGPTGSIFHSVMSVSAVPEPEIFALILGGLAAIGYRGRRFREPAASNASGR